MAQTTKVTQQRQTVRHRFAVVLVLLLSHIFPLIITFFPRFYRHSASFLMSATSKLLHFFYLSSVQVKRIVYVIIFLFLSLFVTH